MSLASESASRVGEPVGAPTAGSIIAQKYQVERKLGAGGMGVVVAARHLQLNQLVAIKFLHPGADPEGIITKRFLREARAAAALKGEHVARVFDVGTLDDGSPFMVMEYLEGMSVSKLIRRHAPLPINEAVDLMMQACKAMEEAHQLGIVHRDIKPGNMFLTTRPDGSRILKVLDFGISKLSGKLDDEGEPTLTASNMVLGSPKYFSPEQVKDAKNVDHRADVWALGLVLYYMLTGRRPFEGETMSAVCVAIATETPPRLIDLRPEAPRELDAAVMGCLIKDPERRTQSTTDFARAIAPFASNAATALPGPSVPTPLGSSPGALVPLGGALAAGALPRSLDDSRSVAMEVDATNKPAVPVLWLQVGGAVAVLGVILLVLLLQSGDGKAPSDMGSVAPVAPAAATEPSATEDTAADEPTARERSVVVPGDGPVRRPQKESEPDLPDVDIKAHALGTTQATVKLMQTIGGQDVVGVVPKGEVVVIKRIMGEYALVLWVDKGKSRTGWTFRNLIE